MKKMLFFVFVFISTNAFSQEDAWVYFNAKPNSQTYLSNPLTMLSQRALDRRVRQNIALDYKDVPIFQSYIDQITAASGIVVKAKSKWFNALHIQGTQADIQALLSLSFVTRIDFANRALNLRGTVAPLNKSVKVNKKLDTNVLFNYGNSANQIRMLHGDELHAQNYTGSDMIIAIMDAGFPGVDSATPFARLRTNNKILGGYDYVNRNSDFYTGLDHGTMVLSTMGGFVDNQLVGTAPDASYYLFITEDGNNEGPIELSLWVEAAEEADRLGVDIITTSLGYTQFDNPNYDFTYNDMNGTTAYISKGLDIAFSRGMICVVSAGNEGGSNWHYISAPADAVHALAIGAVNASGNYASFSSYGPSFDGRVKPDVAAQGQNSVLSNSAGAIVTASGTSFSGPIIAGMVASFWQALPNYTNEQIVQSIKESASLYTNPNDQLGYGIPNFGAALFTALDVTPFSSVTFNVFPNPVLDVLYIASPSVFENAKVTIYNSLGQNMLEQNSTDSNFKIPFTGLKPGMYYYKIESNSKIQTGKIIKK